MTNLTNPEIFTVGGRMVVQAQRGSLVLRAEHQADGTWWKYTFYKDEKKKGTPLRSAKSQPEILKFIEEVRATLA